MLTITFLKPAKLSKLLKSIGWLYFIVLFFACTSPAKKNKTLKVSETEGISRDFEYIRVMVTTDSLFLLSLKEVNSTSLIPGQSVNIEKKAEDEFLIEYIFPVTIGANETKEFEMIFGKYHEPEEKLKISENHMELKLENSYFIADLTSVKATDDNGIQAGQLAGLVLKQFNNQLLERGHIAMHWTPSFQKDGMGYKTMAHLKPRVWEVNHGRPYRSTVFREGYVQDYEEIHVSGTYEFFVGLPYFVFTSEMIMEDSVELTLLRNNEMTMDSLFTHLVFPGPDGTALEFPLYDPQTPERLDKDRIPDDVDWLCFYHAERQYAFGSIKLEYDNTNQNGQPSPTFQKHTKISTASNGGRYWDRRLIHLQKTLVPQGSRYFEKNAYLTFRIKPDDPSATIREYFQRLNNPLEVSY